MKTVSRVPHASADEASFNMQKAVASFDQSQPKQRARRQNLQILHALLLSRIPHEVAGWRTAGLSCDFAAKDAFRIQARVRSPVVVAKQMEDSAESPCQPELLDFEQVMTAMKYDFPQILRKEPVWDFFSEDFKVIDQSGAKLEGLSSNKLLWKLLHRTHTRFAMKDDIKVNCVMDSCSAEGSSFDARCKVQFGSLKPPLLRGLFFLPKESPIDIEADMVLHLNGKNQADSVRIEKWLVNGQKLKSWPEVHVSGDLSTNLRHIKQWAKDIKKSSRELQRFRQLKNKLPMPSSLVGQEAPDFEIEFIGGEKKKLSTVLAEEKPLVINFYMNF